MSHIKQEDITLDVVTLAVEQKIAAGNNFDGTLPSLSGTAFVPYQGEDDGVIRMRHPDTEAAAGDTGGLFTFDHKQPIVIQQIFANFGAAGNWVVAIATSSGAVTLYSGTGEASFTIFGHDKAFTIMPGESIKVTHSANGAGWARVYAKLAQSA